ncbi:hypothetical protein [Neisseria montereyensis]|uniref:Uncharacterized protein n=1 Tax=Neisseria montereyensis TaxID=2973938 RepID=A0ABT2FA78_9NEIS|nr:hypothetical protein [Neisseria montereyensis]MCS4533048.1 hypothetical protein [Neisseria montereyensis]
MNKTVVIIAALLIGGLYYIQENPEIKQNISQTFSRKNLLEAKFKDPVKQKEYEENRTSLFFSDSKH